MGSKRPWNDRNQSNYDRYFGDKYEKPRNAKKPNYNSAYSRKIPSGKRRSKTGIAAAFMVVFLVLVLGFLKNHIEIPSLDNQLSTNEKPYSITSQISFDKSEPSLSTCIADPDCIPEYEGADYVVINKGNPNFTEWDFKNVKKENYSKLDKLGRCGTAIAMLDHSMMPTEERGNIGQIKPTGWVQNKYENIIDSYPPYLYNRCHLIAYALTGQNANECNLITGTRYLNATSMLPWEEKVMRYVEESGNHVLYRVTPYFVANELLARGVEMEAYSVEDNGEGIRYHVFLYNIQPGIELDYQTGNNQVAR